MNPSVFGRPLERQPTPEVSNKSREHIGHSREERSLHGTLVGTAGRRVCIRGFWFGFLGSTGSGSGRNLFFGHIFSY